MTTVKIVRKIMVKLINAAVVPVTTALSAARPIAVVAELSHGLGVRLLAECGRSISTQIDCSSLLIFFVSLASSPLCQGAPSDGGDHEAASHHDDNVGRWCDDGLPEHSRAGTIRGMYAGAGMYTDNTGEL